MRRRLAVLILVGGCVALWSAAPAEAQIFPEGPLKVQFQLDFSNPGARSLGLAGAFLGRADDVTAAYANPAGLRNLTRPEVSIEGRSWRSDVIFRDSSVEGQPEVMEESSGSSGSFLAVAYPMERVTLALYRHELANFSVSAGPSSLFDSASVGLDIVGVGFSAGARVTRNLSIGASLVSYQSDLSANQVADGATVKASGSDDSFGFNVGLMWDFNEDWTLGWVLRDGPDFDVAIESGGIASDTRRFSVPGLVGVGLSWKASHSVVASVDYYFVQYSNTVAAERVEGGRLGIKDAHELRAGLEYTMWQYESSPALRIGIWRDPAHAVRYLQRDPSPEADALASAFPEGDDEIHFSFGAGVVLKRFQLDFAGDFADSADVFSLSAVFFF
jgi:long-chain fatty acid transport protein